MTPEQKAAHEEISHALYFIDEADLEAYYRYLDNDPTMAVEIALILAGLIILLED